MLGILEDYPDSDERMERMLQESRFWSKDDSIDKSVKIRYLF